jgi:creatinine amidohydrolase/Fe(II)-dependent formamide hydrolase-like protein
MKGIEVAWYWQWQAWPWCFGRNIHAAKNLQYKWWLRIGPMEIRQWSM